MKHFRLLKYAMLLSAFGLFPALSHGAGWRYEDGKLTDGVWSFPATLQKNGINLEVDAKLGTSSAITPCVIDFTQIEGGYKVTKFGQFSSYHGTYPANDKGTQLYPYRGLITEFKAPDCTSISSEACFRYCTNLTTVVLAEGVGIPGRTFEGCNSLVELEPRKFAGIANDAFLGCSSLKGKIENTAIGTDDNPASFGSNAFSGCSSLEEVVAENVKSLGEKVFQGCSSLTNIVLSPQIRTINDWAFNGCAKLTTENVQRILHKGLVRLGNGGKNIRGGFTGCKGLTGALVWEFTGLSTNVVPESCFEGCDSLERVDFKTPVTEFRAAAFYNLKPGAEFHMTVEAPNVFASRATMTTTAPYPKVYLKGNSPAWIEVMNKNAYENIILKDAFNNESKYIIGSDIGWGTIRALMKKDTDMCSYDETENKITVNKRGVLGFLMYKQTSSGKTTEGGCWILKEPEAGFSVIVR